jgi:hypothetical protein
MVQIVRKRMKQTYSHLTRAESHPIAFLLVRSLMDVAKCKQADEANSQPHNSSQKATRKQQLDFNGRSIRSHKSSARGLKPHDCISSDKKVCNRCVEADEAVHLVSVP